MKLFLLLSLIVFASSPLLAEPLWFDICDTNIYSSHSLAGITTDPFNNVYSAATANFSPGGRSFEVIMHRPDGERQWVRIIKPTPGDAGTEAVDVAADSTGIYVLGSAPDSATSSMAAYLYKLDTTGNVLWSQSFHSELTEPLKLCIGKEQIAITGHAYFAGPGNDLFVAAYSKDGALNWEKVYSRLNDSDDRGMAIASDSVGNFYVTGTTKNFGLYKTDIVVLKLSSNGDILWTSIYDGPTHDADGANYIVTRGNQLFVGGYTTAADLSTHVIVLQYRTDSLLIRESEYMGVCQNSQPRNCYDGLVGLALDDSGNLYAIANSNYTDGGGGLGALTILKYRASGSPEWVKYYTLPGTIPITAVTFVLSDDQLHVAMRTPQFAPMLFGFDLNGAILRQESWRTPQGNSVIIDDLFANNEGDINILAYTHSFLGSPYVPVVLQYASKCCLQNRGDISASDAIDLSDLALMVGRLTLQPPPIIPCPSASDLNASGQVDLTDLALMIGYLTLTPRPSFSICP